MSYFVGDVRRRAISDLRTVYECADRAGIKEHLFVCFGLLLGVVRNRDFIPGDDDIDMGCLSDRITKEQEDEYYKQLKAAGMFFARERIEKRDDTDRYTWFSLRKRNNHAKFCHWFWIKHAGYYWHTKAGRWTGQAGKRRFGENDDLEFGNGEVAVMKGIPARIIEETMEIDFNGVGIRIPKAYGACLDFWYPGWLVPSRTKSSRQVLCQIRNWSDSAHWKVSVTRS